MPILQTFERRDDVPEFLAAFVIEKEGKWIFEAKTEQEVTGLTSALDKERRSRVDFEKKLKDYEGIDPEKARQIMADAEKAETEKLKLKGDWESREKQLQERFEADTLKREQSYKGELTNRDNRIESLQRSLEKNLIERDATIAITNAKGVPELLLPHVIKSVKVIEENGEFAVRVVDEHGEPRLADFKGTPLTIAQLVEEMKTKTVYGRAFDASPAGGSGAPAIQHSGMGAKTIRRSDQESINANLERIAKGEITIVD